MHLSRPHTALLITVSGIVQSLSFPAAGPLPPSRAALAWLALVPLIWAVLREPAISLRRAAAIGYACGVLWYLLTCYWVYATMHTYGGLAPVMAGTALVLMCLYLGLYHAVFTTLLALVSRQGFLPGLLAMPFLWVAVELARARITGFPWNLLGYSQIDNGLLTQLAPLTGVYGLSFLLAAVNAAVAGALLMPKRQRPAAAALAAAVLAGAVQMVGLRARPASNPGREKAVLLQPNLDVGPGQQFSVEALAASSSQLTQEAAAIDGAPVRVALWPESPSPFQTDRFEFTAVAGALARDLNAPLIAGAIGTDSVAGQQGAQVYNSAVLFSAGGAQAGRYDKIHLVPFGEFVPYSNLFRFASGLTQAVGLFQRGTSRQPLGAGGHRYGTFLCYESIFGDEVRQFALNGADVLVNLSDDGWYGDSSAPFQHLNMARMRAIENNRWLLRDTNTGVTASIAPDGRVAEVMARHRRGAVVVHFDFVTGTTFYTRHGDVFAYLCVAVALLMLAASSAQGSRQAIN